MKIRNIAIIAHVDHGKTTLVDEILKQSGVFHNKQEVSERAMDSNELERERGITILSKVTSVEWSSSRINIVDTPGHADFGGEVERILSMVDGVLLLVDASEGPMPQTKFVTSKALKQGLRPIVILNKVDKNQAEPDRVLSQVFDLFDSLGASEEQLDFPFLYASGRSGWADIDLMGQRKNLNSLMELILSHVRPPVQTEFKTAPFSMLATILERDDYLGRMLTGRIETGRIKIGENIKGMSPSGETLENFRASKILLFRGLKKVEVDEAIAGDIVSICGMVKTSVSDTICERSLTVPLNSQPIDPPTISVTIGINDSPLAGKEGKLIQSRVIRDRLFKESESNIAIQVSEGISGESLEVFGRGELQIGILLENMRREGFELSVSRPRVVYQTRDGKKFEPIEEITIDVDSTYSGAVIEKISNRKGAVKEINPSSGDKTRIIALIPSRGLIGYHGEFLTDTKGTGILNRAFHSYEEFKGDILGKSRGALISMEKGKAVQYALFHLEDRGYFFIRPGEEIYPGMIVGEHNRNNDLEVNPIRGKKLTNVRASGHDESLRLTTARRLKLEEAISYIKDDELVELTPKSIRLRKKYLDSNERKKQQKL
ncbi:MAG: translational GTPase TypA [Paracoccaceae bacterium]